MLRNIINIRVGVLLLRIMYLLYRLRRYIEMYKQILFRNEGTLDCHPV